jgi:group I intron endonuclease
MCCVTRYISVFYLQFRKGGDMARGIYKIINVVNNKFYIGSAVNLSRRRARHFSELRNNRHNNGKLQNAWNKYGEQAFTFVVVEELPEDADILAAENRWLKDHVGKDYCYNIGVDATAPHLGMSGELSPTWGHKHTDEAKAKIAAASKARVQTDEEKAKRRKSMRGHHVTASTKAKISATLSGEGNYWYGKKRPDHGAKVSRAVVVTDPEGRTETFTSIQTLRTTLDMKPPTVNRALKSGKPISRGPLAGWSFKYLDSPLST